MKKNIRLITFGISLLIVIVTICIVVLTHLTVQQKNPTNLTNGTLFSTDYKIKPFELIDDNGKAFTIKNLKGSWSLLFFGFTQCPMMCPSTLSELNKAYDLLKKENFFGKSLQIVFISVDPEHDTPAVLKKYISSFNSSFIGVTGTKSQVDEFTKQFGIFYEKIKNKNSDSEINHSGAILIISPSAKWKAILSFPHHANTIAEDFKKAQDS